MSGTSNNEFVVDFFDINSAKGATICDIFLLIKFKNNSAPDKLRATCN